MNKNAIALELACEGLVGPGRIYRNLSIPVLCEQALQRSEGMLSSTGALVIRTGARTGRSPEDRFLVREPSSEKAIWWGPWNQPVEEETFERLWKRACEYLQGKDLYLQDCLVGLNPEEGLLLRVVTEQAAHSLFARMMFRKPDPAIQQERIEKSYTLLHLPGFTADPARDRTRSGVFVGIHLGKGRILIVGTGYCGEIKKAAFSVLNYLLPLRGTLSMHCAANCDQSGRDVALFFGLSGTGKTSLSADVGRWLIGDDEHGWGTEGIFNLEGGCYAKVIGLSSEKEPQIYGAVQKFGALWENVVVDPIERIPFFEDASLTENTRAAYPLGYLPQVNKEAKAGHARHLILLTCDAFGVFPPVAKLSNLQALYYFMAGYTAKVAGTEVGVRQPVKVFSPCLGAPFIPLPPRVYAMLLKERMERYGTRAWLLNTGWTSGPYGIGRRIPIEYSRRILAAILDGSLEKAKFEEDPVFGWQVPCQCPGVPSEILKPQTGWPDPKNYHGAALELVREIRAFMASGPMEVPEEILRAGPRV
jgi:phosphoenolpyruvate carboxykinase (ATP)